MPRMICQLVFHILLFLRQSPHVLIQDSDGIRISTSTLGWPVAVSGAGWHRSTVLGKQAKDAPQSVIHN